MDFNADLRSNYERMSDDELLCVARDRAHLVNEAIAVLDAELQKRGLHSYSGDAERYQTQWADYRRRRNLFIFSFLSVLALFLVAATISVYLFRTPIPESVFAVFAVIWLIVFVATGLNLNKFRCPRCGNLFAATKFYNKSMSASRCVHCGLPKP